MTSPKLSVAIIGGGSIAPHHAKYIQSSATCTLSAIIDPFPPGQHLASRLGVPCFSSVREMMRFFDGDRTANGSDAGKPGGDGDPSSAGPTGDEKLVAPEIYIICVPSALHAEVAMEVLELARAKVMLVEKPFATDAAAGQAVLDLARRKGCKVAVGHHRRFHPAVVAAKRAIEDKRIGSITALSGMWVMKKSEEYFDVEWRRSRALGGGPVWANLVHDVDLLQYLVGSRVSRVWAAGVMRRRKERREGDGVEEGAVVMLRFESGVVGSFVLADNVPSPYAWEPATGENPLLPVAECPVDVLRVFGTRGTLTVPDGNLWTYDGKIGEREVGWGVPIGRQRLDVEEGIPFQSQVENLARVALGEEEPLCPGVEGLAVVKVCEAIVEALDNEDGFPHDID